MPGPGWSRPKPWHWRWIFRWWLDDWRRFQNRSTTEQWLEWALVRARPYMLQEEVASFFRSHIRAGEHPSVAAQWAVEEWDL